MFVQFFSSKTHNTDSGQRPIPSYAKRHESAPPLGETTDLPYSEPCVARTCASVIVCPPNPIPSIPRLPMPEARTEIDILSSYPT